MSRGERKAMIRRGAEDQRTPSGASDLSLSSREACDRATQSGLVRRHHLHPGAAWLFVSGRNHGLGDAPRYCLAAVEQHGCPVCIEALNEALARYGRPEIFNID